MFKKLLLVMAGFMVAGLLTSCSKAINTLNGLTTFQSTISGSNYPFTVDKDGNLSENYEFVDADKLIGNGDNFSINLDGLFLRYLQASDPYIVIYSEAWMGSGVRPVDNTLLQRQILLLKDGSGFNSRLPISWIPLLGPVTMEEDSLDVYVSLKVVVLSKNDNEQTTQLLDGIASVAGTVAPQYALIAGTGASIGKAIVAQNKDKIEFEHTFNLSPRSGLQQVFKENNGSNPLNPPLAESKLVVIKGENEHRLVPYANWFYYIWPPNWYGHRPSKNSLRFEGRYTKYEFPLLNSLPNTLAPKVIDEGASYSIVNLPFKILSELLVPGDSSLLSKQTTSPDNLTVKGSYLLRKSTDNSGGANSDSINDFLHTLYSEKTHVILTIKRTAGSHGNFNQIKSKFSLHAELLNKLLFDDSSSDTAIEGAFDDIKKAAIYENNRKKIVKLAKTSAVGQGMLKKVINVGLDDEEKNALRAIFWRELSVQSGKRLKSSLDTLIRKKPNVNDFYADFEEIVNHEKTTYWTDCNQDIETQRSIAWFNVVQVISDYLFDSENTKKYATEVTREFREIKKLPNCAGSVQS